MPSSSFLAKLLENEVLGIQMKFETKLRNYIISKEQKYFVRQQDYFARLTNEFSWANKWFIGLIKKILCFNKSILLDEQNIFITSTEQFC